MSLLANEIHVMADGRSVFTLCFNERNTFDERYLEPTVDGGELVRIFARFETVAGADFHVASSVETFEMMAEPVKVVRH